MDLYVTKTFSEIYHNFSVGTASVISAISLIIGAWAGKKYINKQEKIKQYRSRFPIYDFGQDKKYSIVRPVNVKALFLIEWAKIGKSKIHHIQNMDTLKDLGYDNLPLVSLPEKEFKDAERGDAIDTTI